MDNLQPVASTWASDYFISPGMSGTYRAYRQATARPIKPLGGIYASEQEARAAVERRADRDI